MASLKAIRTRIASVKSTQKITRAMKLVSAARLRRAQDAIVAARPYANALATAVAEIASRAGEDAHPLMVARKPTKVALIAVTSDRGLAGGFNAVIFRRVARFQVENPDVEASLIIVGKKGRDFFRRRKIGIRSEMAGASGDTAAARAKELAVAAVQAFDQGFDAVHLVYNEFKSAIVQRVVVEQILPVPPPADAGDAGGRLDILYEPDRARMTAMDNATTNARDMIASYTLQYNRARQAAITKELMEIVGGAEALKG
jgi:F-type H+-transporting ATPase subunit gamma